VDDYIFGSIIWRARRTKRRNHTKNKIIKGQHKPVTVMIQAKYQQNKQTARATMGNHL
jgi:hypothetical protein